MITLIGRYQSIIGFGLTGISDIREVAENPNEEEVVALLKDAQKIILIEEDLYEMINEDARGENVYIKIPSKTGDDTALDSLIKDTIGVSLKNEE